MGNFRQRFCTRRAPLLACLALVVPGLLQAATIDATRSGPDKAAAAAKSASSRVTAATVLTGAAYACKEQSDGKIVVAGHEERTLLVLRFNADGTPDATFGSNGRFLLPGVVIWHEGGVGLDMQSDGSIVLAAMTYFSGPGDVVLVRLTPGGLLDTSFAGTGVTGKTVTNRAFLKQLFVLADGKILTGGNDPAGIWAGRYLANGDADASFGTAGVSFINQPTQNNYNGQIGQLLALPDGKMLMLSLAIITSSTREAWVVDRLTDTGALDPTFTRISLPYDGNNFPIGSLARLNDGRLAVSMPRFDTAYSAGDIVALYSADGVRQSTVTSASFVSGLGVTRTKWDYANHLMVRSDGSLCGRLGGSIVQLLPTLKVLATASIDTSARLFPVADGGVLEAGETVYPLNSRPLVRRFTAAGTVSVSYFDAGPAPPLVPEIVVESPASISDGSSIDLGTAVIKAPALTRLFTIRNTGTGSLNNLAIGVDGPNTGDFTASALSSSSIAAGGSQSFTVSFAPTAAGPRTATLHIASNDANKNPFDIVLTGQGSGIDIAFAGGARLTRPTQLIDLGTLNTGSMAERSFTIQNTGPQALTGLHVTFSGLDAAQFTITPALPGSLAVGESFTFTVRFSALLTGSARASTLTLLSDVASEVAVSMQFSASVLVARLVIGYGSGVVRETDRGNTVVAWGNNYYGQTNVPAGLTGVVAIAAGGARTVALKQDGSVVAWGYNYYGQTNAPAGLTSVVAVAAGGSHTVALKQDGIVVAWGLNDWGQTSVPAGLTGVIAIAAGWEHTMALKQDGSVVAWGYNGYGQTSVPAGLTGVVAIAAGTYCTVALKQDGSIVAWGYNGSGQTSVPAGLTNVVAIAAGEYHRVALKQDGSVVAWGLNGYGQTSVPAKLTGVVAIAAGAYHTVALKQNGSVIAWGDFSHGQTSVPAGLTGVVAIAAGGYDSVALVESAGEFGTQLLGQSRSHPLTLQSTGTPPLTNLRAVIEGPDADQFRVIGTLPASIALSETSPFTLSFVPTRAGPANATIKIYSNDPVSPFVLALTGTGKMEIAATKPGVPASNFTYAPLRLDRSTGLMLQKISFTNTTGSALNGLRLVLSKVAPGIAVYSSSAGTLPLTLEVLYTNAIAPNETISFDLVYSDPKRRIADSINPTIMAESLETAVPAPGPVTGTLVPLLSARPTVQGPMLEWNAKPGATYVVEYSDDNGTTWFSAVHRLGTGGTRMFWVDRGQPETQTKPTGTPNQPGGRFYRVKKL